MPYTPPSHRSPASSTPTSPDASRRPSIHTGQPQRPTLPRSTSYLTKHRRTPSAVGSASNGPIDQPTPEATSEDLKGMVAPNSSVRQSPPPVTKDRGMPNGAIISPPDSASGSDEDDLPEVRGRRLEENFKQLHHAVSQIPVHRESSPTKNPQISDEIVESPQTFSAPQALHLSLSTGSLEGLANGSRTLSHMRSAIEPHALVTKSADNSVTASEEESEEEEVLRKPQMVRKKSGELVRPALRPPSRRRPSSMPGTPTFSKAVHFDSHLEHVRHFLQVDRPLAVSAGSSPADNYESDGEYPFPGEQRRTPPYEWEILMQSFPVETPTRKRQPVRLERIWLSNDQKCLIGSVAVVNLSFHKSVTCRFTLDYWKTTSEIGAEYVAEIVPKEIPQGHDRFNFTIKLSDLANLESKTLYLCIRYNVNGQEFWDNNGGTNFQVDFKKKMLPQNGKNNFQGAGSRPAGTLPRSNRRANPSTSPRPKSMPVGFDDFGENAKLNFDQSLQDYLGEAGPTLRLKGVKSTTNLPSDNLTTRLSSPSGQAFANRYDFGASLTAAVQAAKDAMSSKPDGLYMKLGRKPTMATMAIGGAISNQDSAAANIASTITNKALPPVPQGVDVTGSPSISSATYEELVNKYCFFGSKQSSPQLKDGTLRDGQLDGPADAVTASRNSNSNSNSYEGSPLPLANFRPLPVPSHHGLHPNDPNPYFQFAIGGSPVSSPLRNTTDRSSSPLMNQPRSAAPVSGQSTARSVSPASMVGGFPPFAGTSPNEFQYQDRFPFIGTETHTATAIRG